MEWSDRNTVLARAEKYDLQLDRSAPERPGQPRFAWRWHDRDMGREFPTREVAIDWMAEWLDADTAKQESAWSATTRQ
jgi:hypothetical protein